MADQINDIEQCNETKSLLSRRAVLKFIAGAPLVVTFGMLASPLMRFLKPTMEPCNFFQASDLPVADKPPLFMQSDLPQIWNCLPFMFPMKYLEFNPEGYVIRKIPAFIIRVDRKRVVAYSRICPKGGDHVLYFAPNREACCGCGHDKELCHCPVASAMASLPAGTPALYCPYDASVFDLRNDGQVVGGPAPRPPRQFAVSYHGDSICIGHIEYGGIA